MAPTSGARRQARPTLGEGCWWRRTSDATARCMGGLSRASRALSREPASMCVSSGQRRTNGGPGMTQERMPQAGHPPTAGSLPPAAGVESRPLDDPRALQILSTEHWSLLATRSLTWSESFSRTGLFLSVLSAGAVALGLVGGAVGFTEKFTAFALALLPVILFV